jgi:hypothetical protein
MNQRLAQRVLLGVLLAAAAGCSSPVETTESASDQPEGRGAVVVHAVWQHPEEEREVLFGGLECRLHREEPVSLSVTQLTEPGRPLRFDDLGPGAYTVTVAGETREFTTGEFQVHAGKERTVRIDLLLAKERATGKGVLSGVGSGAVRLITAPVRLAVRLLDSDVEREDAFDPQED